MNAQDARAFVFDHWHVPRETQHRLDELVHLVVSENNRQNLISQSTVDTIWTRHILDSVQLVDHAPEAGSWLDLGSGAGFPGLVIAILRAHPTLLVESRRLRSNFLKTLVAKLGLSHVTVIGDKIENFPTQSVDVISARAFAPLTKIFVVAERFAHAKTVWVLPKGRGAQEELAVARESWQGVFHVKPSITESDAAIIVAQHVRPKGKA